MFNFDFVRVRDIRTNQKHNWLYYVTDPLQLIFIHEQTTQNRIVRSFESDIVNKDIIYAQMLAEKRGKSEAIGCCDVVDESYKRKEKYLNKFGHILINHNGGFFFLDSDCEVIEKLSKNNLIFPELSLDDIRVKKTPQGRHWYAWVGIHEVWIDNEHKWNTYQYAYEMAVKFLNNKNSN